jgi:hypothetical protein
LLNDCQTSINPIEPELNIHYDLYKFKNPEWRPSIVLENYFPPNTASSHYSADFDTNDYNCTDIEIVLETLFDDSRLHLTEKSLRPIACGQPFILAGTHNSLEYLRSYGFKTFGHIWDESYDLIEDPCKRLETIADLMKQIANWTPGVKEYKLDEACKIAKYNLQHFFSQIFFDQIITELKTNLTLGFNEQANGNNYTPWINGWIDLLSYPEIKNFLTISQHYKSPNINNVNQVLLTAKNKLLEKKST